MENYQLAKVYDYGGDLSARWYVEYKFKHPDTGKYVKYREWLSKTLLTRSARYVEALKIKKKINDKLLSGFDPFEDEEKNYTFQMAFNEALKLKGATIGDRANTDYASHVKTFIAWLKDKNYYTLKPAYFNFKKCQQFADYLSTDRKLANRTRNNYIATLRGLFKLFKKRGIVDLNHWENIDKLRVKETAIASFTDAERLKITELLPSEHYPLYCVALIIYYCYIRPTEITRIRISDIDFKKSQINVSGYQSKNGKTKPVVMHPHLSECLKKLNLQNFPEHYYVFASSKRLQPSDTKVAGTRIADAWRLIMKNKHGFTKNIYDLKATGAGQAFDSGIDARQIQLQIRHASLDETQRYLEKISNKPGQIFREKMPVF